MAARKVFTDKEIETMISDLAAPKATKTAVAKKWGIAATTLTKKIGEFEDKQSRTEARKDAKRHKRLTQDEKDEIVRMYSKEGMTMMAIATIMLRSSGAVKKAILDANIPVRGRGKKKEQTITVGDTENPLSIGSRVFSFTYNMYGTVTALWGVDGDTFRVWLASDDYKFSAYQPREKLALIA